MSAISVFLEHTAMFLRRIAPNALTRKNFYKVWLMSDSLLIERTFSDKKEKPKLPLEFLVFMLMKV